MPNQSSPGRRTEVKEGKACDIVSGRRGQARRPSKGDRQWRSSEIYSDGPSVLAGRGKQVTAKTGVFERHSEACKLCC
jgi:hypothetical protein